MLVARRIAALVFALLACGPGAGSGSGSGSGQGSTTGMATTSNGTMSASTTTSGTTGTTTGRETGTSTTECFFGMECSFSPCPDVALSPECDIWAQDCPAGQHCTYLSNVECVDVPGAPLGPLDPCDSTTECPAGHVCKAAPSYADDFFPIPNLCRPLCTGSPERPSCPPGMFCELEDVPVCYSPEDCRR